MSRREPFISEENARHLLRLVNRAAASFDVAALPLEEVMALYVLLERCMDRLWHEHERVLVPLYEALHRRHDPSDDESQGGERN